MIYKEIRIYFKTFNQVQDHVSGVALRAKTEGGSRGDNHSNSRPISLLRSDPTLSEQVPGFEA
jgi:hypothetical protein